MGEPLDNATVKGPGSVEEPATTADLRRRAVRGGAIVMVSRLGTQLFVWAATLLTARFLEPSDYAMLSLGLLLVTLGDMIVEAGIGRALVQKTDLEQDDLDEAFSVTSLLALVAFGTLIALADPAEAYLGMPGFAVFLRVLAIHLVLAPFEVVPMVLLDRSLSMGKQSVVHVAAAVLQAALVLALAIEGLGYWALAVGSLTRRVFELVVFLVLTGWRPRLVRPGERAKRLLRFGVHVSLATFLWFFYSNIDYVFVRKLVGAIELGYYALAFQLISLPAEKLTANVNKVAFPTFCRLQTDPARLHDWFVRLLVLLGFLGMPVMVGMALVAEDGIVLVLGETWRNAVLPFQLLSLAGLFRVYGAMFPVLYAALGRPDITFKYNAVCAVVFPLSFWVAGLSGGMIGICLVWMVAYPLIVAAVIHCTRHLTHVGLWDVVRSQTRVAGATLLMTALVLATQWAMEDAAAPVRLVAAIAAGVVTYTSAMWVLGRNTVLDDLRKLWRELRGQAA